MNTVTRLFAQNTAQRLGITFDQAYRLACLYRGVPERISLDRQTGEGFVYFWDSKCPAELGTNPESAALLADLLAAV